MMHSKPDLFPITHILLWIKSVLEYLLILIARNQLSNSYYACIETGLQGYASLYSYNAIYISYITS